MSKAKKARKSLQCPVCSTAMERRTVAACAACGAEPRELTAFERGRHTYEEWLLFPELGARGAVVLCNYCEVDIASYAAERFGLPPGEEVGARGVRVRSRPDVQVEEDWVCPECGKRSTFLNLVAAVRRVHAPAHGSEHRDLPQN
jgi:rubrerythrin